MPTQDEIDDAIMKHEERVAESTIPAEQARRRDEREQREREQREQEGQK